MSNQGGYSRPLLLISLPFEYNITIAREVITWAADVYYTDGLFVPLPCERKDCLIEQIRGTRFLFSLIESLSGIARYVLERICSALFCYHFQSQSPQNDEPASFSNFFTRNLQANGEIGLRGQFALLWQFSASGRRAMYCLNQAYTRPALSLSWRTRVLTRERLTEQTRETSPLAFAQKIAIDWRKMKRFVFFARYILAIAPDWSDPARSHSCVAIGCFWCRT